MNVRSSLDHSNVPVAAGIKLKADSTLPRFMGLLKVTSTRAVIGVGFPAGREDVTKDGSWGSIKFCAARARLRRPLSITRFVIPGGKSTEPIKAALIDAADCLGSRANKRAAAPATKGAAAEVPEKSGV